MTTAERLRGHPGPPLDGVDRSVPVGACKGQTKEPSAREPMGDPVAIAANTTDRAGPPEAADWHPAVNAKPVSRNVTTGLAWLVAHQLPGGGWGQGDEAATMGSSPQQNALASKANVADTSMAIAALMRSGSTPSAGEYRDQVRRGITFVLSEIEEADADSLYVTEVRGTRVQSLRPAQPRDATP